MLELPFDILFNIIEEIGMQEQPDFDLLWAFCSTCRILRTYAQKFLFHSLSLTFTNSTGFTNGIFWEHMELIVDGNPEVAAYVKYLGFRAEAGDLSPRFVALLSKFTALETLRCGLDLWADQRWASLQDSQKQAWTSIFRLPSVQNLQILNLWNIPISVLFPCTRLRSLYLDRFASFDVPALEGSLEDISHLPLTSIVSVQADGGFEVLKLLFKVYPSIGVPLFDKSNVRHLFMRRVKENECVELRNFLSLRSFGVEICKSTFVCH